MDSINEEKQRMFLARPRKQRASQGNIQTNMFLALRSTQPLPSLKKIRGKSYDFVGSQEFKQKYIQPQPKINTQQKPLEQSSLPFNMNNTMNSTINRNTILSKLTRQQNNIITKQARQLHRYKQYQNFWDSQSKKLHKKTLRKKDAKTLLQQNVKDVYAHPNQDRMDLINNFVVNMWQMSLRNNNKILQRHIKGNKYNQVELQQMLQTDRGLKTVEKSIPVLPLEKLKEFKKRELSLSGRNKALSQTYRTGQSTQRISLAQTQNQQQVYKISYTGNVKWMSTQGL